MSRAFVKEDDGPSGVAPVLGAALPPGTPNLATPWSAAALRDRLARARDERSALRDAVGLDASRKADLDALIRALEPYVASLREVAPPDPPERAGFGVAVTVAAGEGERTVAIVGIDEADPAAGRVSFVSPVARALIGAVPGDVVTLRTPRGTEELEVIALAALRGP